jgi:hypothetical protein
MNIRITTVFVITGVIAAMLLFAAGPIIAAHQALAFSNTGSANGGISSGGASSGTRSYNSNGGQIGAGGGSSGATTGGGSTGQSVDRHLFCNTGMITPICK